HAVVAEPGVERALQCQHHRMGHGIERFRTRQRDDAGEPPALEADVVTTAEIQTHATLQNPFELVTNRCVERQCRRGRAPPLSHPKARAMRPWTGASS